MAELNYTTIYQRGYSTGQKKLGAYITRAVKAEAEVAQLRMALARIADMDPNSQRADDLGRAAGIARSALAAAGVKDRVALDAQLNGPGSRG